MRARSARTVSTPCTGVCRLDEHGACIGCGRTRWQIAQWLKFSERERQQIMRTLASHRPRSRS